MYFLTQEELETFRQEFQEKEKEVQRYIGVYLSGLVLFTGWIIGPQSAPMLKMVLGNGGYNIYGVLVIVSLNVLFTCFLLYKSLIIHEINQFITYQSSPKTGFKYWEAWRRSSYSATRFARPIYSLILAILPISVSILLLYGLNQLFRSEPQSLVNQLARIESNLTTTLDVNQLASVLNTAWNWYLVVIAFHILPLMFLWLNWRPNDKRWEKINSLRGVKESYNELKGYPETISSNGVEIQLYNKQTKQFIDKITQDDLKFLINNLVEESETDNDYYLTKDTIELLQKEGASPSLVKTLKKGLGRKSSIEIQWFKDNTLRSAQINLPKNSTTKISRHDDRKSDVKTLQEKAHRVLREASLISPLEFPVTEKDILSEEERQRLGKLFAGEKSIGDYIDEDREGRG